MLVPTLDESEKAKMRRALEAQRNYQRQSQTTNHRPVQQSLSAVELREKYKGEADSSLCPFFMKTGACRFGNTCSKPHPYPAISPTLMIKNMYGHELTDVDGEREIKSGSEGYKKFVEFFHEIAPEFQSFGQVLAIKVCSNLSDHLKGHTYVTYSNESEAKKAYDNLNGRFYAAKPLVIEFSPVVDWESAICSSYGQCQRGKGCNFLHVFKNPGGLLESIDEKSKVSGLGYDGVTGNTGTSFVKGGDSISGNVGHETELSKEREKFKTSNDRNERETEYRTERDRHKTDRDRDREFSRRERDQYLESDKNRTDRDRDRDYNRNRTERDQYKSDRERDRDWEIRRTERDRDYDRKRTERDCGYAERDHYRDYDRKRTERDRDRSERDRISNDSQDKKLDCESALKRHRGNDCIHPESIILEDTNKTISKELERNVRKQFRENF